MAGATMSGCIVIDDGMACGATSGGAAGGAIQGGGDVACCGGGATSAADGCVDSAVAEQSINWAYIGEKQGSYEKVEQYQFVGDGRGDFMIEEDTTFYGCRVRPCCLLVLIAMAIALLVGILVFYTQQPTSITTQTTVAAELTTLPVTSITVITTASIPYDCDEDYHDCYVCLRIRWSFTKRRYCCAHTGRGCPTTTTEISFDCNAGFTNWALEWSPEKQAWCCARTRRGCPTTPCPPGQAPR